ncbi:MAG: hypothetical protein K0S07_748 [Chlamydiales bacterium]|jgi:hypothetical protein|nr:hypothetical protein [Chlamydiales bacterium]
MEVTSSSHLPKISSHRQNPPLDPQLGSKANLEKKLGTDPKADPAKNQTEQAGDEAQKTSAFKRFSIASLPKDVERKFQRLSLSSHRKETPSAKRVRSASLSSVAKTASEKVRRFSLHLGFGSKGQEPLSSRIEDHLNRTDSPTQGEIKALLSDYQEFSLEIDKKEVHHLEAKAKKASDPHASGIDAEKISHEIKQDRATLDKLKQKLISLGFEKEIPPKAPLPITTLKVLAKIGQSKNAPASQMPLSPELALEKQSLLKEQSTRMLHSIDTSLQDLESANADKRHKKIEYGQDSFALSSTHQSHDFLAKRLSGHSIKARTSLDEMINMLDLCKGSDPMKVNALATKLLDADNKLNWSHLILKNHPDLEEKLNHLLMETAERKPVAFLKGAALPSLINFSSAEEVMASYPLKSPSALQPVLHFLEKPETKEEVNGKLVSTPLTDPAKKEAFFKNMAYDMSHKNWGDQLLEKKKGDPIREQPQQLLLLHLLKSIDQELSSKANLELAENSLLLVKELLLADHQGQLLKNTLWQKEVSHLLDQTASQSPLCQQLAEDIQELVSQQAQPFNLPLQTTETPWQKSPKACAEDLHLLATALFQSIDLTSLDPQKPLPLIDMMNRLASITESYILTGSSKLSIDANQTPQTNLKEASERFLEMIEVSHELLKKGNVLLAKQIFVTLSISTNVGRLKLEEQIDKNNLAPYEELKALFADLSGKSRALINTIEDTKAQPIPDLTSAFVLFTASLEGSLTTPAETPSEGDAINASQVKVRGSILQRLGQQQQASIQALQSKEEHSLTTDIASHLQGAIDQLESGAISKDAINQNLYNISLKLRPRKG